MPRSLEVCDSRGLQFVAKICHKCSHPGAQATRQNLKKIASPARDKNRSCSRGLKLRASRVIENNVYYVNVNEIEHLEILMKAQTELYFKIGGSFAMAVVSASSPYYLSSGTCPFFHRFILASVLIQTSLPWIPPKMSSPSLLQMAL